MVGEINPSGRAETAPLGQSGVPVGLEIVSAVGMALRVEMIMDRGMDCGEFLQGSHTCVAIPLSADRGDAAATCSLPMSPADTDMRKRRTGGRDVGNPAQAPFSFAHASPYLGDGFFVCQAGAPRRVFSAYQGVGACVSLCQAFYPLLHIFPFTHTVSQIPIP